MQASEMLTFASAFGTRQKVPKERGADILTFGLLQLVLSRLLISKFGDANDARTFTSAILRILLLYCVFKSLNVNYIKK